MVPAESHALWTPVVALAFEELEIGASFAELGPKVTFHPLHRRDPSVILFELQGSHEAERQRYNRACLEHVYRERQPLLGEHVGFNDYFAPLVYDGRVQGALVCGPFL